jgi:hypothetical protein
MMAAESNRWLRIACGVVSLGLVSPLELLGFGPFGESGPLAHLDGFSSLAVMLVATVAGVLGLRWSLRSWSAAALVASAVNLPLAVQFGSPESGAWASLLGVPKYFLFGIVGWVGWRRPGKSVLRWTGAVVPTALVALPIVIELAAGGFTR